TGAKGCSHGWSGGVAQPAVAEPVEEDTSDSSAASGQKHIRHRCPRVALRSTRGYNPQPRWGCHLWMIPSCETSLHRLQHPDLGIKWENSELDAMRRVSAMPGEAHALIVVDMQNDFVLPGAPACVAGAQATLPKIREALDFWHQSAWPVI